MANNKKDCVPIPFSLCFNLNLWAISQYMPPKAHTQKGDLNKGFLIYEFWGLIFRGLIQGQSYFQNLSGIITFIDC